MKLSVIVPCYNGAATIAVQLEALAQQQYGGDWEIIVVNNGSTDHSMEIVEQYRDRLPPLAIVNAYNPPEPHLGVAHSYNVGVQSASGDCLAFCEADDEVSPTWVATVMKALAKYDIVTGPLDCQKLDPPWVIRALGKGLQQTRLIVVRYYPFLPFFYGCNVGFRRTVYEQVGEFDEAIRYAWDMDYSWRAQQAGIQIQHIPEMRVHYRRRHTFAGLYRQAYNWSQDQVLMRKLYQCPSGRFPYIRHSIEILPHLLKLPMSLRGRSKFAAWYCHLGWYIGRVRGEIKYHLLGEFDESRYIVSRQRQEASQASLGTGNIMNLPPFGSQTN